jgi:hypothetical protein
LQRSGPAVKVAAEPVESPDVESFLETATRENQQREDHLGQPRLSVSEPEDKYELEATQVATEIMYGSSGQISPLRKVKTPNDSSRNGGANMTAETESAVRGVLQGPSQRLDPDIQDLMESKFNESFEGVRVHNNPASAEVAEKLDAQAFTVGNHIVFGQNKYNPYKSYGSWLIAHELVHTLQQKRGKRSSKIIQKKGPLEMKTKMTVSKSEVGWKKKSVSFMVRDFKGDPFNGRVWANFTGFTSEERKTKPQGTKAIQVKNGVAFLKNIWMKPEGTIQILAHRTPSGIPLQGVSRYSIPKNGPVEVDIKQQNQKQKMTATNSREAARKAGVTGTAGVDYKVVSSEVSTTLEQERKRSRSVSRTWTLILPDSTLEVNVNSGD